MIQASLDVLGTGVRGDDPKLNSILKNAGKLYLSCIRQEIIVKTALIFFILFALLDSHFSPEFLPILILLLGDRLRGANEREKQHFEAIKLCNDGRFEPALEIWDKLMAAQPWDVLALKYYSDVYVLKS